MRYAREIRGAACWCFAAILSVCLLVWVAQNPSQAPRQVRQGKPLALAPPDQKNYSLRADVEADEMLNRPLFSASRRPYVAPEPIAASAEPAATESEVRDPSVPSAQIVLAGVYIAGESRRAFIVSPSQESGEWLTVGGSIDGWTITEIESGSVTISAPPRSVVLQLYVDNSETH